MNAYYVSYNEYVDILYNILYFIFWLLFVFPVIFELKFYVFSFSQFFTNHPGHK